MLNILTRPEQVSSNWLTQALRQSEVLAGLGVNLSFDECWNQYREQAMHGLMISIIGACFSEAKERSDAMFMAMIQRHLHHCVDLDSSEFLA